MSVKLLFIITETFFVKGRGIILAPGISNIKQIKIGDMVELRNPDGTCMRHAIKGIEIVSYRLDVPREKQTHPIILDSSDRDVPQGTEVWHEIV